MTTLFGTAAAIALALGAALTLAPHDGFETEVFIDAPPETVWALLTDPVEHQAWSPNMHRVTGRFAEGERVSLTMGTPAGGEITFRPEVLVADVRAERLDLAGRLGASTLFDARDPDLAALARHETEGEIEVAILAGRSHRCRGAGQPGTGRGGQSRPQPVV